MLSKGLWTGMRTAYRILPYMLLLLQTCRGCVDLIAPPFDDLLARCTCGSGATEQPAVRCGGVAVVRIAEALRGAKSLDQIALVNGSVKVLEDSVFEGLEVRSLQLTNVGMEEVAPLAFQGVERSLSILDLSSNELREVPSAALSRLGGLSELDLSRNRITNIEPNAFTGLSLSTLKLADNPLIISAGAFRGLEQSLHNLNLKETGQESVPEAVRQMAQLSFLDLSQNKLPELRPDEFGTLAHLTALTLERNSITSVDSSAFRGMNGSLSSLSLLNNKIEEFPLEALRALSQLRVLDLGFNRIKVVPNDAFSGNALLTLLALDGNPLSTLSEVSFIHLNSTLRGISVGGSTLVCDCRLRWLVEWVRRNNLQVTSRERNPQFCGRPATLRRRVLPQMAPQELKCDTSLVSTTSTTTPQPRPLLPATMQSGRDMRAPRTSALDQLHLTEVTRRGSELIVRWEGYREDNLVRARSAVPVYAMYRVFGEPHFSQGVAANPMSGWAQFNVPETRPLIVCVVDPSQAASLTPNAVPRNQCSEVTVDRVSDTQLTKIIIGSSAGVCGMVVVAVIIFLCCNRRSNKPRPPSQTPYNNRPVVKSEHEWETASMYSARSIPRVRAYHGSMNPSYAPDDVQSFRSLPPARSRPAPPSIALSQLSGHHSFLGAGYGNDTHNGWSNHHWDNGDAYSERHAPSRLSYGKDNF